MMESVTPSIHSTADTFPDNSRKKRRKTAAEETDTRRSSQQKRAKRWRTEREQQIYSSKLAQALRRRSHRVSSSVGGAREIRETAYRVLAVSARGRTRWSRAILASGIRATRGLKRKKKQMKKGKATRKSRLTAAVERKVKVLSRLVPGCRKLPFPKLLEEATDYITALKMQVRCMTDLAELLATPPPALG